MKAKIHSRKLELRFWTGTVFVLESTQEPGVFTVTTDESKTGVATNVQGFASGAWLEDTVQRFAGVLGQMEEAETQLFTCPRRVKETKKEDFTAGSRIDSMLSTNGRGHLGYVHLGQGSGRQRN